MTALPEQGRLEEHPLPRLLLELQQAGWGGALVLSRDRVGKRFLFQEGVPVFAESNLASESLGVQLMDAGKLSRPDYNKAVAHIERSGAKEGAAFLELGLLKPKDLFDALKNQVRVRLVECFGWPAGEFHLDADSEPPADAQPFRLDLHPLLQEGLEAHWSQDRVLMELAPNMERFPVRSRSFERVAQRLHVDAATEELLEALDGTRTFWKAVQLARTPRALAAAWVLGASGGLDFRDTAAGSDAVPEIDPNVEIVIEDAAQTRRQPAGASSARSASRARPAALSEDKAQRLRQEIIDKHESLGDVDHYTLLGLERNATDGGIKRAYLQAAKTYHPDALSRLGLDDEIRELANRVFGAIGKAHAVLSDASRRRDYDSTLDTDSTQIDANMLAQAETLFRKAEVLIKAGNFRGAVEFLEPAVDLWPDECAYQSALGWVLYKKVPSEPERAREHLEIAARIDPDDGVNLFRLSVVLRDLGHEEAADQARQRAQALGAS